MVLFNYQRREITGKIVYYGPGLCGKTTNLQYIHDHVDPKDRGKMVSLATDADRTLFFDFMPIDAGYIKGMKIKFQFYTVPGQVHYNETRKMVLRGADAVVFVADSQSSLFDSNIYSYDNMIENLKENGLDPNTIPLVIQYNKRDLDDILSVDKMDEKLNLRKVQWFEAIATAGDGVMETFQEIGRLLLIDIGNKYKVEVTSERENKKKRKKKFTPKTEDVLDELERNVKNKKAGTELPPEEETQFVGSDGEIIVTYSGNPDENFELELEGTSEHSDHDATEQQSHSDENEGNLKKGESTQSGSEPSIAEIEYQMDLKITMQRLKKISEDNYQIMEKQMQIMQKIEEIKEEFYKHKKNK